MKEETKPVIEPPLYEKYLITGDVSEFQKPKWDTHSSELPDRSFLEVVANLKFIANGLKTNDMFPHYNFEGRGVFYTADFFVGSNNATNVKEYNDAVKFILTWYANNLPNKFKTSSYAYSIRSIDLCIKLILQPLSEITSELCRYSGEQGNTTPV